MIRNVFKVKYGPRATKAVIFAKRLDRLATYGYSGGELTKLDKTVMEVIDLTECQVNILKRRIDEALKDTNWKKAKAMKLSTRNVKEYEELVWAIDSLYDRMKRICQRVYPIMEAVEREKVDPAVKGWAKDVVSLALKLEEKATTDGEIFWEAEMAKLVSF